MKSFFKSSLALLFAVLTALFSLNITAFSAKDISVKVGDSVKFGSYPQSRVTASATIKSLNTMKLSWRSYSYYSGKGGFDDAGEKYSYGYGTMASSDFMKYADVTYNGNKYRAVKFTSYRPDSSCEKSAEDSCDQADNGYKTTTTYWFKYEPLLWRVLNPKTGYLLCETIIDSQAYSNTVYESADKECRNDAAHTHYANDYATSSVRKWLNNDFLGTAFSSDEKTKISKTKLDNTAANEKYNSTETTDLIFLPSYEDIINPAYGFSTSAKAEDTDRVSIGSDYAKCQGLWVAGNSSSWRLRTAGQHSYCSFKVGSNGTVSSDYYDISNTDYGIRPALRVPSLTNTGKTDSKTPTVYSVNIIKTPEKLEYKLYENVSTKGLSVIATYTDGKKVDVTKQITLGNFATKKAGKQNATVSFEGKTDTFKYTVTDIPVKSIKITANPNKITYHYKSEISSEGLRVVATYADNTKHNVSDKVKIEGFETDTPGAKKATVSFGGKSALFSYKVLETAEPGKLESLKVVSAPSKTSYEYKSEVSSKGIKVMALYAGDIEVDVTKYIKVENFSADSPGKKAATVSYEGKEASFEYEVEYSTVHFVIPAAIALAVILLIALIVILKRKAKRK